jgi:hypothetical protein
MTTSWLATRALQCALPASSSFTCSRRFGTRRWCVNSCRITSTARSSEGTCREAGCVRSRCSVRPVREPVRDLSKAAIPSSERNRGTELGRGPSAHTSSPYVGGKQCCSPFPSRAWFNLRVVVGGSKLRRPPSRWCRWTDPSSGPLSFSGGSVGSRDLGGSARRGSPLCQRSCRFSRSDCRVPGEVCPRLGAA